MQQWQIGRVSVTRIVEMEVTGGTRFILPEATREACQPIDWLFPHFMDPTGRLIMSIHALVVDTGARRIIVDTCVGNDKERAIPGWDHLQTSFLSDLEAAGYPRQCIDTVLCTHLHVDHVGWNTMRVGERWVPTFEQARYLVAETEWRYWDTHAQERDYAAILADSVRPVVEAGLVDFVQTDERLCDEVWLEPTPGHTPGHVSVHIESEGRRAVITGDCMHHPVQMAHTEWSSSADHDAAQARRTREGLLERWADTDVLVIGTHFAAPTAGHVKRDGAGRYRFEVDGRGPPAPA